MKLTPLIRLAAIFIFVAGVSTANTANAGIIDNSSISRFAGSGGAPLSVGGTFAADENNLASFTLNMFASGVEMTALVYGTDSFGTPTGSALWTSDIFTLSAMATWYTFNPMTQLTPGSQYFIGARNINGGQWFIGLASNPLDPGSLWNDSGNGNWQSFIDQDLATRIEMTTVNVPVPAPASFILILATLGGLLLRHTSRA